MEILEIIGKTARFVASHLKSEYIALFSVLVLRHVDIQRNIPIYCCRFLV